MNNSLRRMLLMLVAVSGAAYGSTDHYAKKVSDIQVNPTTGCLYFKLAGVAEADPVTPGNPWFAIEGNQPGKQDILALLMLARTTGQTVKVIATGSKACGYAETGTVRLENSDSI